MEDAIYKHHTFFLLSIALIFLGGCDGGYTVPLTDYQKGYNEGADFGRHSLAEGELKAGAVRIGMSLRMSKIDATKSDDWNTGFLAGYKSVVDK